MAIGDHRSPHKCLEDSSPLIVSTPSQYTITVASPLPGNHATQYSLIMAGAAVASIPQILFYIFFRKKIIAGIATSGMKG